jgi:amino acid adenylation domain-containing protein
MSTQSFRLSPQQEDLWLAQPDGPAGRTQALIELEGRLGAESLRAAIEALVARHEILRTTFARQTGLRVPLQTVHTELSPAWEAEDLRPLPEAERAQRVLAVAREELIRPLDLERGPLVRAHLCVCGDERHVLVLTCSSLCIDASSLSPLMFRLAGLYADDSGAVEDPLQFADVAEWEHETLTEGEDLRTAQDFWARFDGAGPPALPFAGAPASPLELEDVTVPVDDAVTRAIVDQAARYGASVPDFVQAAWHTVLARATGQEDVTVALVTGERQHPELEGAIGPFARRLPIRTKTDPNITFTQLLERLGRAREEAVAWKQYLPAGAFAPLTVGFISHGGTRARGGSVEYRLRRASASGEQFALWLTCHEEDGQLAVALSHDVAALPRPHVERLAAELGCILASAAREPGAPIGELDLLPAEERHELLVSFNATETEVHPSRIEQLFAARAAEHPERTAVTDGAGALTYAALEARANQLAHRLRRAGAGEDTVVGLCTDRSIDMVVGLLGILKAGAAYLPLHFEHPASRLAHQLTETGARVIVTQAALEGHLPEFPGEVIRLDGDGPELEAESPAPPPAAASADGLAYVIYTSGSTGQPKGVAVTQSNLVNYTTDIVSRLGAGSQPLSFGLVTAISTDLGNTSVFPALCSGGTLVLVPPGVAADPAALALRLQTTPVDVLKITPSHLSALLAAGDARLLPRRTLVTGGERLEWQLVERVRQLGACEILNHYGPTETTVGSCVMPVPEESGEYAPASVPIGRPIANTTCYVLDQGHQPVPLGAPGRLYIGGAGVARGYVGQDALTGERFLDDPFAPAGGRVYDTGDLARWLPDGTLEFLGRADEQVKIRGFRVEPAEVGAALRSYPGLADVAVVTRGDAPDVSLVAYCVAGPEVGEAELRGHLADLLPDYMIPAAIVILDKLPLTPSGKLDRQALPAPTAGGSGAANGYVAPRTPIEEAVAAIWSQVLGVERVGVEDNFFTLGGHSLLATQVVAHVRTDFAIELPLHSLFTSPTVASLSAEVMEMMGTFDDDETAKLVAELEGLSDGEAERLLAGELSVLEEG